MKALNLDKTKLRNQISYLFVQQHKFEFNFGLKVKQQKLFFKLLYIEYRMSSFCRIVWFHTIVLRPSLSEHDWKASIKNFRIWDVFWVEHSNPNSRTSIRRVHIRDTLLNRDKNITPQLRTQILDEFWPSFVKTSFLITISN